MAVEKGPPAERGQVMKGKVVVSVSPDGYFKVQDPWERWNKTLLKALVKYELAPEWILMEDDPLKSPLVPEHIKEAIRGNRWGHFKRYKDHFARVLQSGKSVWMPPSYFPYFIKNVLQDMENGDDSFEGIRVEVRDSVKEHDKKLDPRTAYLVFTVFAKFFNDVFEDEEIRFLSDVQKSLFENGDLSVLTENREEIERLIDKAEADTVARGYEYPHINIFNKLREILDLSDQKTKSWQVL